ncbi:MAG: hypothetical protein HY077_16130 [Elusimicrobia bacterium]|nr:hypothetical protein [Elusimicrobiota bacterium]
MSDAPLRYAVLLSKPEEFRPVEIARALAGVKKVPEQDLVPAARRCWGIVEDDLPEAGARELVAALEKAGLGAVAVPRGLIEEPAPVSKVHLLAPFKPERLAVLAAAGYKEITTRTIKTTEGPDLTQKAIGMGITMMTGLPTSLGKAKKEVQTTVETAELVFFLDLVLKDPAERLRIDAQDFDFSCLGAKKSYSAIVNFRQLLYDLADASRRAIRNRGTTILLEQKPVREMGYESLKDLERECRWLLTLAALAR